MSKTIIKEENGKEVAYSRESFFGMEYDVKIGELHEKFDGSKVTRTSFGHDVKLERERTFDFGERKGSVDGIEGKFTRDKFFDIEIENDPSFKPDKKDEPK